jgi:hypothetical protein
MYDSNPSPQLKNRHTSTKLSQNNLERMESTKVEFGVKNHSLFQNMQKIKTQIIETVDNTLRQK